MHKLFATMTFALLVVAFGASAFAKTETVRGRVVDHECYLNDTTGNVGVDHKRPAVTTDTGGKGCAIECAKKAQPMAVLTADGKLYTIVGGLADDYNAKLVPHIGHMVEITGETTVATTFDSKTDMSATTTTIAAADLKMIGK